MVIDLNGYRLKYARIGFRSAVQYKGADNERLKLKRTSWRTVNLKTVTAGIGFSTMGFQDPARSSHYWDEEKDSVIGVQWLKEEPKTQDNVYTYCYKV